MRKSVIKPILLLTVVSVVLVLTSCTRDYIQKPPPPPLVYAGADVCMGCHNNAAEDNDEYDLWSRSAHAYALTQVGVDPNASYPDSIHEVQHPAGYNWKEISYVIGGYSRKAHFTDNNGYVITQVEGSKYDVRNNRLGIYEPDIAPGTKKFDCGKCHTTGWKSITDGGSAQDGLAGMDGQFDFPGVQCEACHGRGSDHATSMNPNDITKDETPELCQNCHSINADNSISAEEGFISDGQQYSEWATSNGHFNNNIDCATCHDPHLPIDHDAASNDERILTTCEQCHTDKSVDKHMALALKCKTCHMPKSIKSVDIVNGNIYHGDVGSHIFKINPASDYFMLSSDGTTVNADGLGLSLDYICYQCHKDENSEGGQYSKQTMESLSAKATGFHD